MRFDGHTNDRIIRSSYLVSTAKNASANGGDASRVRLIGNIYLIWHIE